MIFDRGKFILNRESNVPRLCVGPATMGKRTPRSKETNAADTVEYAP